MAVQRRRHNREKVIVQHHPRLDRPEIHGRRHKISQNQVPTLPTEL